MKKKVISILLLCTMIIMALAGCAKESKSSETKETGKAATNSSTSNSSSSNSTDEGITLTLCYHTPEDFYNESIVPIIDEFKKIHPEVKDVTYTGLNGMSDEQQVTRLTGGQYEDVVLIPTVLLASELKNYFAPLGDADEMAKKYYYGDYMQYEGESYGIPIGVVYEGLIYNKRVLDEYCGGLVPKNYDEFTSELATLKENGITGIFTNAGAVWTMRYWDNLAITMSGDHDYANKIVDTKEPWAEGTYLNEIGKMLGGYAANGYLEPDVVTGDQWDSSLTSIGSGQTAFMLTGTWAVSQAKEHAVAAGFSADDIGFIPFPYKNNVGADNKLSLRVAQDLFMGVNKDSKNMELAKEFCAFFCERISLPMGMNEIKIDGGKNQPDLAYLQELDYVETYTSPAKDSKIAEMAGVAGIDVYSFDGFLLDYVILPSLNGKEPEFDKLNEAWKKNF